MIRATLETRHFSFEAYGKNKAEALDVLRTGWNLKHRQQYPDAREFDDLFACDVEYYEIKGGKAYRDREELI